jgi:hypothetical protein
MELVIIMMDMLETEKVSANLSSPLSIQLV